MKEFWTTIQVVFAGIGGWLGWFLGGCDGLLYALLAFVVIDYVTGMNSRKTGVARDTAATCRSSWVCPMKKVSARL